MSARNVSIAVALAALVVSLAFVPSVANGYQLSLAINIMNYTVLATAWTLFSGPTRYVSLATVAFFGIGAYTVAVLGEVLAWPLVLLVAFAIGFVLSLFVGLATLRLSGVYFVIFTFGLAELVRQLVTWYEVNVTRTLGRYVFVDITTEQIYWQLLALAVVVFLSGWLIQRSKLGLALRVIGDDEAVARHVGINTTLAKVVLFAFSASFMTLAGAVMAPRWTYIDPAIAFNPVVSFQVLIMALLGGVQRLYGPVFGVIPLVMLFEVLLARFPNHFSIMVGIAFLLIVYAIPRGIVGLIEGAQLSLSRMKGAKA
ncbi:MAG: branched-chain amino acid ABC transporter permease [Xanthobacteraceae bacterium]|nr:branched-chain amino acid ABC transporter permease [Xanthobacteraceae bacterium]MCW5679291.1 branched-chain amino acid ABC transporter permease [Xanthobacteraceae bacterium]